MILPACWCFMHVPFANSAHFKHTIRGSTLTISTSSTFIYIYMHLYSSIYRLICEQILINSIPMSNDINNAWLHILCIIFMNARYIFVSIYIKDLYRNSHVYECRLLYNHKYCNIIIICSIENCGYGAPVALSTFANE